ncbi:MAG: tetratricopeptide repeat-containing sensor histidine kinase [Bacteroidales bacterium]|nr:tetratricopeptide repeat-containing sensor histidine kinase [Bacteroidales bacterium]
MFQIFVLSLSLFFPLNSLLGQGNVMNVKYLQEMEMKRLTNPNQVKHELLEFLPKANQLKNPEKTMFFKVLAMLYVDLSIRDSALTFNRVCLAELNEIEDPNIHFDVYNTQGQIFSRNQQYDSALYYFMLMRGIAEELNDTNKFAAYYNNIAIVQDDLGHRLSAYENYMKALELFELLDDQPSLAVTYNNLALINQTLGELEKSIEYFNKAIEINIRLNNLINLAMNYNNLGISYKELGRFGDAITVFQKSVEIAHKTGSIYDEARTEYNLGNIYKELGDLDLAKKSYLQSLKTCSDNDIQYGVMLNYNGLAKLYEETENWEQCEYFASRAIKLAQEFDHFLTLKESYRLLSVVNEKRNNNVKALEFYKLYHMADDTVTARDNRDFIIELQTKYDTERKELENETLKLENDKKTQIIRDQKIITLVVSSALFFVIMLAIFLIRTQRSLKRANQKLNALNMDFAAQNKLLEETINTRDKLFSIIGHDLRSPFNSMLGFLNLMVEDFDSFEKEEQKAVLSDFYKKSADLYNLVENLLQWALQQKGEISYQPDYNDLWEILNEEITFLKSRAERKQIAIQNEVPENLSLYCDRNMISTIFRNIINNAIKFTPHHGAVTILAEIRNNDLDVIICDTGNGMDDATIKRISTSENFYSAKGTDKETGVGLGLKIVKDFIRAHNGEMLIKSNPGKGSCFIVRLNKH